jgi:thioester reductase-like protein
MFEDGPFLLLTGATGLVGSALLKLLTGSKTRRFALIARQPEKLRSVSQICGVNVLAGDITRPQIGLDDQTYAELKHSITEIIHCAANTRFGTSLECARQVNVTGTRHVLDFASECTQLQKFAYISTVYVVGRSTGHFREDLVSHQNDFCNAYQQSKYEAEELVSRAMNVIPAAIFRLSSVIGDSDSGRVHQFNHVHRLIRLFPQNVLPMVPGQPDAPIDLIASDWAMAALAYLFDSAFVPCRVYHLCAGAEKSLSLREMIELTISVFENHPIGRRYLPIHVPDLVPLSRYEEFVEQRSRGGDRLFNELVRVLGYFLPHLAIFQAFDNRTTMRDLGRNSLQLPSTRVCYESVVRFCLDTNWGKSTQRTG